MPALLLPAARPEDLARANLGERLRAAARIAAADNPLTQAPWTVSASWTSFTAYPTGAVVGAVVGGLTRTYVQLNAAAASGVAVPTWRTDAVPIADGGLSWMYAGDAAITANDIGAPTLGTTTGPAPLGAGNSVPWYRRSIPAPTRWRARTPPSTPATTGSSPPSVPRQARPAARTG